MPDIVLATINARYAHASLGLRCLMANLGALEARARMVRIPRAAVDRLLGESDDAVSSAP